MALFRVSHGPSGNLPSYHEGYCYFTTDDGRFHIDTIVKKNDTDQQVRLMINPHAIVGLDVSGKVITYTKNDGTTGTITTQDTDGLTIDLADVKPGSATGVNADTLGGISASDYVLKTDTIKNATNAVNSVNAETAADSNLLGGKEPKYYLQSYDLLDNSNFANLIAQAGLMGNHGNVQYLADRWLVSKNNITVTQMNGYCSITRDSSSKTAIMQRIPENMAGKTLTFAAKVKCIDKIFLEFCRHDDTRISNKSFKNVDGIICYSLKIPDDATDVAVKMYLSYEDPNVPTDIYWLAVYEDEYTAETLPPYVPKGYAAELAECQRYYEKIRNGCSEVVRPYQATTMAFTLVYSEKRIANPTITFGNTSNCISLYGVGSYTPTSVSSAYPIGAKSSRINCIGEYDTAKTCSMDFTVCNVEISADL